MSQRITSFTEALLAMDRLDLEKQLASELRRTAPLDFVEEVMVGALDRIGEGWQEGTVSLSQVYMGGRLCEQLVDDILPPASPERKHQPKTAICTLADHHQLGKSIVYSILRASGFEPADYGTVDAVDLAERVKNDKIEILLISVLMLSSALKIKEVKELLSANSIKAKIIVGGAPFRFDNNLWKEVGADGMCRSASEAARVINKTMAECS